MLISDQSTKIEMALQPGPPVVTVAYRDLSVKQGKSQPARTCSQLEQESSFVDVAYMAATKQEIQSNHGVDSRLGDRPSEPRGDAGAGGQGADPPLQGTAAATAAGPRSSAWA